MKNNLSPDELKLLNEELTFRKIVKGQAIHKQGQICTSLSFVKSGAFKMTRTNEEGTESIIELVAPGFVAVDYLSFIEQSKSDLSIIAIKNSEVQSISHSKLELLYKTKPLFERISRLATQTAYVGTIKRFRALLTTSPENRYNWTLKNRPEIFVHFPQYMIASYLGVSAEWLSKIRSRAVSKKILN